MQTEVNPSSLGGVPVGELAQTYGTPLLVIDTGVLDASIERFAALGAELDIEIAYAGKAFLVVALARRLAATPLSLDVCSLGELHTAELAGFPAERIVMHGCGKSDDELRAASEGRVGRLVIDNLEELERLAAFVSKARPLRVLMRLNTGIEAHTHAYVRTGGEDSKFGFSLTAADAALDAIARTPGLIPVGVHAHVGSQILEAAPFAESLAVVLAFYAEARSRGILLEEVIAGGGFGIDSGPEAERLPLAPALRMLAERRDAECKRLGIPVPKLGVEPGRAIVAEAGTSLYRVISVKHHGTRRFAIVDGGLADNPRPALYGAYHRPHLMGRSSAAPLERVTVCGRSCENDELVDASLPADLRAGDLVAMQTTGAYTYSMASNYNRFARPAVVFAEGGRHRAVVRRESLADLVRNDEG